MSLVPWLLHRSKPEQFDGTDAVVTVVAALVLADLSYRHLELPFLRIKSRFEVVGTAPGDASK